MLSGTTISFASEGCAKKSQTTLREAKHALDAYIQMNHPSIKIGSTEYRDYLVEQLVSEHDKELAKEPNYNEYLVYAARFISQLNNSDNGAVITATGEKGIDLSLSNDLLDKTVSETLVDFEIESKSIEKEAAIEKHAFINSIEAVAQASKKGYSPKAAADYGYKHGTSYNTPAYPDYISGDCTNFVSQCVKQGGKAFDYAPGYKNKPDKYETTAYWYSYKKRELVSLNHYQPRLKRCMEICST